MNHALALIIAGCGALLVGGCGELDPAIGAERGAVTVVCQLKDSQPDVPTGFAQAAAVFERRCSCHVVPGGLGQVVGRLDLTKRETIMSGGTRSNGKVVVPGDPCRSTVVLKTIEPPPFGARMPFNGTRLPQDERQIIIDWIAEGANP